MIEHEPRLARVFRYPSPRLSGRLLSYALSNSLRLSILRLLSGVRVQFGPVDGMDLILCRQGLEEKARVQ